MEWSNRLKDKKDGGITDEGPDASAPVSLRLGGYLLLEGGGDLK